MRTPIETAGRQPRGMNRMRRLARPGHWIAGLIIGCSLGAPGLAWTAQFKKVPGAEEESGAGGDMILGLVHTNTLFFVALGIFAVFWFLFGGGRKAKIGRKGH